MFLKSHLLLVLFVIQSVHSRLSVYDDDGASTEIEDVPAAPEFGPRIPKEGMTGKLKIATPDIFGCSPLDSFETLDSSQSAYSTGIFENEKLPIFALVSRSLPQDPNACTFETKVNNAQTAGAKLVIVFDYTDQPLFHMQRSNVNSEEEELIPSVLVSQSSGRILHTIAQSSETSKAPLVYVDGSDPYEQLFFNLNMTMVGIVSGFVLTLFMCASLFLCTRRRLLSRYEAIRGGPQPRPLTLAETSELLDIQIESGSLLLEDCCSICLEGYFVGDRVIPLNCGHFMHRDCLLPWLSERQGTCPLCKADVTAPLPCNRISTVQGMNCEMTVYDADEDTDDEYAQEEGRAALFNVHIRTYLYAYT